MELPTDNAVELYQLPLFLYAEHFNFDTDEPKEFANDGDTFVAYQNKSYYDGVLHAIERLGCKTEYLFVFQKWKEWITTRRDKKNKEDPRDIPWSYHHIWLDLYTHPNFYYKLIKKYIMSYRGDL